MILKRREDFDSSSAKGWLMFSNFCSMAVSFTVIALYVYNSYYQKTIEFLKSKGVVLNIGFSLLNIIICVSIYAGVQHGGKDNDDPRAGSHYLRWLQAIAAIVIWSKSLYFMQVFD